MALIRKYALYFIFALAVAANFCFWHHANTIRARWANVPQAPAPQYARMLGLGDDEIAYRMTGYFLQNLGNTGGDFENVQHYDFPMLGQWFDVADALDPRSDYVPYLAAYYFGATEDPEQTRVLVQYLHKNGNHDYPQKWRWFAQAIYKAQYIVKDDALALSLANELSAQSRDMDPWARQLPAFIELKMGRKEAAYGLMLRLLKSGEGTLPKPEINSMIEVICTRTLSKDEAAQNPLCQNRK